MPYVEGKIGKYQCGFYSGRSMTDEIFTLRQILERCKEFNIATHHLFIAYKSAYVSININELYKAMEILNTPSKLIRFVKLTKQDVQTCVRIQLDLT